MSYTQIKPPIVGTVGQDGLCLDYVTRFFGVPDKYDSATDAWADAQYKHPGEQPPSDVAVPVWFSYNGPDGHVAGSVPGTGVYSTSAQGDKTFTSVQALVSWMGEGFKYLGWSEDINSVRVVQPQGVITMPGLDLNGARILAAYIGGRDGRGGRPNALAGDTDADLIAHHVGVEAETDIFTWFTSDESHAYIAELEAVYAQAATNGPITKAAVIAYVNKNLS